MWALAGTLGVGGLALGKKFINGATCTLVKDMTNKVVVITGGNTGIGKETARGLAQMNATVIIAARDADKAAEAINEIKTETTNDKVEFIALDLGELESIRNFAKTFKSKYSRLDVLINNAGVVGALERQETKDGFEMHFGINHLGHFYLTTLLLDTIKASGPSKIINVSSRAQGFSSINWDDVMAEKKYSPLIGYNQSKYANVVTAVELQRRLDLENANVKVVSLHPGIARTEINRHLVQNKSIKVLEMMLRPLLYYFFKNSKQGAQTSLYCALEDNEKLQSGGFYLECSEGKINKQALKEEEGKRLWELSEKLLNEKLQGRPTRQERDITN